MTMVRALLIATLVGGLALGACGGAGSGPYNSASPALGTNNPAPSATPTEEPYSEGY